MSNSLPWLVGGNFNVILSEEKKIRGIPIYPQEYKDFVFCVNSVISWILSSRVVLLLGEMVQLLINIFLRDWTRFL